MKHKKLPTLLLILMLALTGCGGEEKEAERSSNKKPAQETTSEKEEDGEDTKDPAEEGDPEDDTDEGTAPETDAAETQEILATVIRHHLISRIDGKDRATGVYPEIVLADGYAAAWPKLRIAVEELNASWAADIRSDVSTYAAWAEKSAGEEYGLGPDACFSSEVNIAIQRIDEDLFSVMIHFNEFSGGAHPMHGTSSINLDPVSGEKVPLAQVLDDTTGMSEAIYEQLKTNYPDVANEVSAYAEDGEVGKTTAVAVFDNKLAEDSYTWSVEEQGLYLAFSPYEIACYAAGYSDVTLSLADFPDLIQPAYQVKHPDGWTLPVKEEDTEIEEIEPDLSELVETLYVENPSWDYYLSPDAQPAAPSHISLKKTAEDTSEWLNTDAWCESHGFLPASGGVHEDDTYRYVMTTPLEYDYMYSELLVYDKKTDRLLYDVDARSMIMGPDEQSGTESRITQFLRWAQIVDDTLYVSAGHNTYASSEKNSSYLAAIDLKSGRVLWKSKPLTSNGWNFQIVDDTIICGYGFTDEPDYIYLLDRYTGGQLQQIPVKTGPDQFEVVGDTLYVATYNTAYEYAILR